MGVWIETLLSRWHENNRGVTPFVGVWIETRLIGCKWCRMPVTPFVGVWIETASLLPFYMPPRQSHPSWVCGLKLCRSALSMALIVVTPFVGVWIETPDEPKNRRAQNVTPFVGVWIETCRNTDEERHKQSHPSWVCGLKLFLAQICPGFARHTLRGCVD